MAKTKGLKMSFREKALIKILVIITEIIGKDIEGFYAHKLTDATKDL